MSRRARRLGGYEVVAVARTAPGTTIENRAPAPGTFSAQTCPPAAVSIPRVIESPIPVPIELSRAAQVVELGARIAL